MGGVNKMSAAGVRIGFGFFTRAFENVTIPSDEALAVFVHGACMAFGME